MGADYQHLSIGTDQAMLEAFWVHSSQFGFHWHYHPELEITCVIQGRGTRLVGDSVQTFEAGDFVFMGSNLPHTWISDDDYNQSGQGMEVAVLQFTQEAIPALWLNTKGFKNIRQLLANAHRGVVVSPATRVLATDLLVHLIEAEGFEKFQLFLKLLDVLGASEQFELLASKAYVPPLNITTEERILRVCRYVHDHFVRPIKLEEVAKLANMNPTSFCRFFKKSTGQSLSEYIKDLRIAKACNLLLDKLDMPISQIAFESGFQSQTLFNRCFVQKKKMTPSVFRKHVKHA